MVFIDKVLGINIITIAIVLRYDHLNSLQLGRKALFLGFVVLVFIFGLATAILIQLDLQGDVFDYAVVVLICLYAFVYAVSWLYVKLHIFL